MDILTTKTRLFESLDKRVRPEDVAVTIREWKDLPESIRQTLPPMPRWPSYMGGDFDRPISMARQLAIASFLFGIDSSNVDSLSAEEISNWLDTAELTIHKKRDADYKNDRLTSQQRKNAGIIISRRRYNKLWRLAARMEKKLTVLQREVLKRSLALSSKNRLASYISKEDMESDMLTACFIAYYTARCNMRSQFTNDSQVRAYDQASDAMMKHLRTSKTTNWWAIAHVYPDTEVIQKLDDEQKGVLLGSYYSQMVVAANFLRELWRSQEISPDMVVQRGNDSSTWNISAGAWNKLRQGWITLLHEMGLRSVVEKMCPGKVLRLMAADVVRWHRSSGSGLHGDTAVWRDLPKPWSVINGEEECPLEMVDETCRKHGLDPAKTSWSAPPVHGRIEETTLTPELVHGVTVSSPELAHALRKAGVFSGKSLKSDLPVSHATIDEIRNRHRDMIGMRTDGVAQR